MKIFKVTQNYYFGLQKIRHKKLFRLCSLLQADLCVELKKGEIEMKFL